MYHFRTASSSIKKKVVPDWTKNTSVHLGKASCLRLLWSIHTSTSLPSMANVRYPGWMPRYPTATFRVPTVTLVPLLRWVRVTGTMAFAPSPPSPTQAYPPAPVVGWWPDLVTILRHPSFPQVSRRNLCDFFFSSSFYYFFFNFMQHHLFL